MTQPSSNSSEPRDPRELKALIATTITSGIVQPEYAACHEEMRVTNERAGFQNIEYRQFPSPFVESGRDSAAMHALQHDYDAVLYIDADMTFPADTYLRLLELNFQRIPHAAAIGAYCTLKGNYLPTIDTGTGTWEPHLPNSGIKEVIRTGGACVMVKTHTFRSFGPPWWRSKIQNKAFDALSNVDNFARCKLSGKNPFYDQPEWLALMQAAKQDGWGEGGIGEDSGFCDRVRAAGGLIFVDTGIVCGHVGKKVYSWQDLKDNLEKQEKFMRMAVGVQG